MRLTDPFENQYTKVGKVPKLESVHGIALYDPTDGKIVHMHKILNFEGASPADLQEKEKEVLERARKNLQGDVTKLKVLHTPNMQEISGQYSVNVKENTLVRIPETELLERLRKNQK